MTDPGPQFVIAAPPHRRAEREYALSVLLGEWLGVPWTLQVVDGLDETRIRLASDPDGAMIVIPDRLLGPSADWLSKATLPEAPLPSIELPDWTGMTGRLPLLYATASASSGDGLVERDGKRVVLGWDLLGSAVFLLGRYEEFVARDRLDARGRFPSSASVLDPSGWLQWPVLDMYLQVFVSAVRLAWPALQLVPVADDGALISHDIDHPAAWARWHGADRLRIAAADLVRRRDPGLAVRRAGSFLVKSGTLAPVDPYNTYRFLMDASEAAGVRSTFFLIADDPEPPDGSRFRLTEPWAASLIATIGARGHTIGLHGSYHSSTDPTRLTREWALLASAAADLPPGVLRRAIRQHFLMWQPGLTWRAQVAAGLEEDHSLGFADAIGYRAGTARSFTAYDLVEGQPLPLRVRPLHVMDASLLEYMAIGPDAGVELVAELARRTRRFGGRLSLLWHNSSLETAAARRYYLRLLAEVTGRPS